MPNFSENFEAGTLFQLGTQANSSLNFLDLQDKKPRATKDSLLERLHKYGPSQTPEGSPTPERHQPTERRLQPAEKTDPIIEKNRDWTHERNVANHTLRNFQLFDSDGDKFLSRKELEDIVKTDWYSSWTPKDKHAAKYILNNFDTVKNFYDESDTKSTVVQSTKDQSDKGQWNSSNKPDGNSKHAHSISLRDTQMFSRVTSENFDPGSAARSDTWDTIKYPLMLSVGTGTAAGLLYAFGIESRMKASLIRASAVSGIFVATELGKNSTRREEYLHAESVRANLTKAERFL